MSTTTPTRTEIRYRYDEELARRASRRFLSRYARGPAMLFLMAILAAALFALQSIWWLAISLIVLSVAYAAVLLRYRSRAARLAQTLGFPEVSVVAGEEGLTFDMPSHHSTIGWTPTRELWQFDDVWLFFAYGTRASYTAFPSAALTPEFRDIVLAHMRAAGAKVR
jgi:hypothetical protein